MKAEYQITLTLSDEEAATLARLLNDETGDSLRGKGFVEEEIEVIWQLRETLEEMGNKE